MKIFNVPKTVQDQRKVQRYQAQINRIRGQINRVTTMDEEDQEENFVPIDNYGQNDANGQDMDEEEEDPDYDPYGNEDDQQRVQQPREPILAQNNT